MSKFTNIIKKISDSIFEEVEVTIEDNYEQEQSSSLTSSKEEAVSKVFLDEEKPIETQKKSLKNNDAYSFVEDKTEIKVVKQVETYPENVKKFKHTKVISPINGVLQKNEDEQVDEYKKIPSTKKEVKYKGVFKTVPSPIFGYNMPEEKEENAAFEQKEVTKETIFSLDDLIIKKEVSLDQVDADFNSLAQTEATTEQEEYENLSLFDDEE